MRSIVKSFVLAGLVAFGGSLSAGVAVQGTVSTASGRKSGLVKYSPRNKGTYVITQKQASGTTMDVEIPAKDVVALEIAEPAGFKQAVALVESGKGTSAIAALEKIVEDYAHMRWDLVAGGYLAKAYMGANNAAKALEVCSKIVESDPDSGFKGDLAPVYWSALLENNRKATLDQMLAKAASAGDRFTSASAFIVRGDAILKDGAESAEAAKKALVDGYLRVVLMYNDGEVGPRVRPEALYKAAKCFEKIGQTSRASDLRSELKGRYGSSPWAAR